jgi:hypothetical protein
MGPALASASARPSPPPPPRRNQPTSPAGAVTLKDSTARDRGRPNLPTTMVRCVVGAHDPALTPTSILCPSRHRQCRDGFGRRTR